MSKDKPVAAPVHHPDPYFDEAGHFIHPCWCGREGAFGVGVSLRKERLGVWYCADHWPNRPATTTEAVPPPANNPPDLQALVAMFGGYDRITPDAWAQFDRETEQYRANIRAGARYGPASTTAAESARDLLDQPRTKAAR